jgi:hypothetical protein
MNFFNLYSEFNNYIAT